MSFTASTIDALAAAPDLPERLAAGLQAGGRDRGRQRRFAPELSYGRHFGPAPATARAAAVVALLFRRDRRWHVPLTERPESLARHAGQISLPGGALEPGETSEQAAVRELAEELGIERGVTLLGRLSESYVFASDFRVTPWLAVTGERPRWQPHGEEVRQIIELPLDVILDPQFEDAIHIQRGPLLFRAPCFRCEHHAVWGATAIILGELAEVMCSLQPASQAPQP